MAAGCRLVSYDARRLRSGSVLPGGRFNKRLSFSNLPHASPHHLEDPYVVRPEVGREVAPRDFGAREAAACQRLEQGVVDGGTPRLVRQEEPSAVREQSVGDSTAHTVPLNSWCAKI